MVAGMEFSYRIDEKDYIRATKLARKSQGSAVVKTVAFWAFVIVCLTLLFAVVQRNRTQSGPDETDSEPAPVSTPISAGQILLNVAPFLGIMAIWGGLFFYLIPQATRRAYRQDTNSHGEFTVTLNPQSIAIRTSLGTSYQSGWNVFKEWLESDGIVILRYPSNTVQILVARALSDAQCEELRGILTAALPRKK
jgi:hypothetical protein